MLWRMRSLLAVGGMVLLVGVGYFLYNNRPDTIPMQNDTGAAGGVQGQDVAYHEGATGYYVRPEGGGGHPGVVLIHENRGLRPEIRKAADDLAREGYQVLAVDLYGGRVMETQEEARAFAPSYDQAQGLENMRSAAAYLRQQGASKVGSWGWCFGGARSLDLAMADPALGAAVIYYGSRPVTDAAQLRSIKAPILGIYGAEDQAIPQETVDAFDKALTDAGVQHTFHVYPGVGHAFANPSNPNHHPAHTADAWAKTIAFLNAHLK